MRRFFVLSLVLLAAFPAMAQNIQQDTQNEVQSDIAQETGGDMGGNSVQGTPFGQQTQQETPVQTNAVPQATQPQQAATPLSSMTPSNATPPPANPAAPATQPQPAPSYEPMKFATLQMLDKLTARTSTVTLPVGKPSAVGPLFIDVKTCQKTPPTEQPESAVFMQIWEAKPKSKLKGAKQDGAVTSQWVFSGWMFASSPALSAMNHPVYDVWLKDCANAMPPAMLK